MDVYGLQIPNKSLSNFDLIRYADDLNISNFRGVFMRDELPKIPRQNTHRRPWVIEVIVTSSYSVESIHIRICSFSVEELITIHK